MTGINASVAMDPTTKLEVWLFQKIGQTVPTHGGRPIMRRLPYNLVSFDGDPAQYIEPVNASQFNKVLDSSGDPIDPRADGAGRVVGLQMFEARPFEMFSLNEVDASSIGQLP